jgi:hypothetical protein
MGMKWEIREKDESGNDEIEVHDEYDVIKDQ